MTVSSSVLIVDDDAGFRALARDLLEYLGLSVVAGCEDGASALAACRELRPDGVLLDVNLPDTTGHALAAELLREHPGLRILLTSTEETAGGVDGVPFVPKTRLADEALARYFDGA